MYCVILLFPINGIPHIYVAVVEYVQCNAVEPLLKDTSEIRTPLK